MLAGAACRLGVVVFQVERYESDALRQRSPLWSGAATWHATAFFDTALALECGLKWLEVNRGNASIKEEVLSWMVHIFLKQFRIDVLSAVKAEIREERREAALLIFLAFKFLK